MLFENLALSCQLSALAGGCGCERDEIAGHQPFESAQHELLEADG
jgi:hypothetical protein